MPVDKAPKPGPERIDTGLPKGGQRIQAHRDAADAVEQENTAEVVFSATQLPGNQYFSEFDRKSKTGVRAMGIRVPEGRTVRVVTKGGVEVVLEPGYRGYVAIDQSGHPYPIEAEEFNNVYSPREEGQGAPAGEEAGERIAEAKQAGSEQRRARLLREAQIYATLAVAEAIDRLHGHEHEGDKND